VPAGYLPSEVTAHQVVRRGPLDCWEELVVRCVRFGHPVEARERPADRAAQREGRDHRPGRGPRAGPGAVRLPPRRPPRVRERILDPELPDGIAYTYGNRLRGYFGQGAAGTDTLATVIGALREDPQTRHAYVSLWDTATDLPDLHTSTPCLTTLFFRCTDGRLSLSATYRAHNLLTAWLQNVYGLMAIQRHVAEAVGLPAGPITVVSHSLGADPRSPRFAARSLDRGRLAARRRGRPRHGEVVAARGPERLLRRPRSTPTAASSSPSTASAACSSNATRPRAPSTSRCRSRPTWR
jgi:thymidylate synthase